MQWRGSTNKSPTKLNAAEIKFDTNDLFTNRKNHRDKTPQGEFKVTTPNNPLLSKQTITICKVEFNQPFCWLYSVPICL